MTRLHEPRTPAWFGILAAVVFALIGCGVYLTITKAIDCALVAAGVGR